MLWRGWVDKEGFGRNCLCFTSTVPVFFHRGCSQDTRWPMPRLRPSMNQTSSLHQATSYTDREMFPSMASISSTTGPWFSLLTLGTEFYIHVTVHRDMWPCIVTCDRASCHVTVHRDMWPSIVTNFHITKPTRCTNFWNLFWKWKSTCFGQFLCPSSGVIHCTLSNGICHTGL
jgi:hypothetical protein